ncbi:hypothetical protein ACX80H_01245 [Arthrobacter sp. MDT2-2]
MAPAPSAGSTAQLEHTATTAGEVTVDPCLRGHGATAGCEQTEVFVSSSVATYADQPGPVNKQGLTAVFVRVTDTCATAPDPVSAAAGGGAVLFQAEGQTMAPLVVDPRLAPASIDTRLAGSDGSGDPVTIALSASWTATGPLQHVTSHSHEHHPGEGNVNATDNSRMRAATADVSVTVGDFTATGTDTTAVLEQTK